MSDASPAVEKSVFAPVQVGDEIAGRYRVTREIGAGGMGQVLEVEHVELEKRFALKLVRPDRWDATLDARFRREARALARVTTPRVPQITDFGVDSRCGPFYVMELVDGVPLDELLSREGPLARERALELAIGIAEALVDVHAAGIVHRDVKPSNIGVCGSGPVRVRLLDFGLATSVDDRFGSRITESRSLVGSLPYMAPEQFHGERPTIRVDLWALGIIVYEMLAGGLPFEAPSTAALVHQILFVPVPTSHPATRTCMSVLSKLLAKDTSERPANATEVIALLRHALEHPSEEAREHLATTAPIAPSSVPSMPAAAVAPPKRDLDSRVIGVGVVLALAGLIAWGASVWVSSAREPAIARGVAPAARAPEPERAAIVSGASEPSTVAHAHDAGVAGPPSASAPEPESPPSEALPRPRGVTRTKNRATAPAPPEQRVHEAPAAEARHAEAPEGSWDGTIIERASP